MRAKDVKTGMKVILGTHRTLQWYKPGQTTVYEVLAANVNPGVHRVQTATSHGSGTPYTFNVTSSRIVCEVDEDKKPIENPTMIQNRQKREFEQTRRKLSRQQQQELEEDAVRKLTLCHISCWRGRSGRKNVLVIDGSDVDKLLVLIEDRYQECIKQYLSASTSQDLEEVRS